MGVPILGGFDFYTASSRDFCFALTVLDIDFRRLETYFSVAPSKRSVSYHSVALGATHCIELVGSRPLYVSLQQIKRGTRGDTIADLAFYAEGAYYWKKFE